MESYYGNQNPYIYTVFPDGYEIEKYLKSVADEGIRFCFSNSFDRKEEHKIEAAYAVLAFIDRQLVKKDYFRDIISSSVRYNKKLLIIYLEDVILDATLTMQSEAQQALFLHNYASDKEFLETFRKAEIFNRVSLTPAQLKNQRRRSISLFASIIVAALALFVLVVRPLLVEDTDSKTMEILGLQGLSKQELESIKELRIIGNEVKDTFVHGWYENNDRSFIVYDQEKDDMMVRQEAIAAGTIDDVSDLVQLKNLEVLQIEGQQIKDITPLFELKKLHSLSINCNPISSLEGIEKLQNLTWLDICATDVSDLSPVYGLKNLDGLQIDNTYISDISGIEDLKNLTNIHLQGTYVKDIPVGPKLNYFEVNNTKISAIPDFKGQENVSFSANSNNIRDISNLDSAKSYDLLQFEANRDAYELVNRLKGIPIRSFMVSGLQIRDLNDLKGLTITYELNIAGCSLSSLSGLENFESIRRIDLKYAENLRDLRPLLDLPQLQFLTISPEMQWMEDQLEGRRFELIIRDD